jgi:3-phosphoshikimate 1-carboxyvinyltransferase
MLIAPYLPEGLNISVDGKLTSSSYVELTMQIMHFFGINITWENNILYIPHQKYKASPYIVESDWSSASYWYQVAALADEAEITLHGLHTNSFQGDAQVAKLFEKIGIISRFVDQNVQISKKPFSLSFFEFDFINNPDLVQTFVVTLCMLNIRFRLSGAETLRIKETDRIEALRTEMKKLGFLITESSPGILEWNSPRIETENIITIETYKDHRMALAFAPAALKIKNLIIKDAAVVTKSYPNFWKDLESVGFEISPNISCKL